MNADIRCCLFPIPGIKFKLITLLAWFSILIANIESVCIKIYSNSRIKQRWKMQQLNVSMKRKTYLPSMCSHIGEMRKEICFFQFDNSNCPILRIQSSLNLKHCWKDGSNADIFCHSGFGPRALIILYQFCIIENWNIANNPKARKWSLGDFIFDNPLQWP